MESILSANIQGALLRFWIDPESPQYTLSRSDVPTDRQIHFVVVSEHDTSEEVLPLP
jgi:hypothetical protein